MTKQQFKEIIKLLIKQRKAEIKAIMIMKSVSLGEAYIIPSMMLWDATMRAIDVSFPEGAGEIIMDWLDVPNRAVDEIDALYDSISQPNE